MATIAIELGKLSSKKTREVYLLVRQGKTRRRVKTGVKLLETEISPKTGKIKSVEKAMAVEKLKCELQESMDALRTTWIFLHLQKSGFRRPPLRVPRITSVC